jgi:hypothetical protein
MEDVSGRRERLENRPRLDYSFDDLAAGCHGGS